MISMKTDKKTRTHYTHFSSLSSCLLTAKSNWTNPSLASTTKVTQESCFCIMFAATTTITILAPTVSTQFRGKNCNAANNNASATSTFKAVHRHRDTYMQGTSYCWWIGSWWEELDDHEGIQSVVCVLNLRPMRRIAHYHCSVAYKCVREAIEFIPVLLAIRFRNFLLKIMHKLRKEKPRQF